MFPDITGSVRVDRVLVLVSGLQVDQQYRQTKRGLRCDRDHIGKNLLHLACRHNVYEIVVGDVF